MARHGPCGSSVQQPWKVLFEKAEYRLFEAVRNTLSLTNTCAAVLQFGVSKPIAALFVGDAEIIKRAANNCTLRSTILIFWFIKLSSMLIFKLRVHHVRDAE